MFVAGYRNVRGHREHLNRINVFPVRDGDTGANMALTLGAVVEAVKPELSYKLVLDQIAETALLNARGNSGIIFAQFLYGIRAETADHQRVSIEHFATSVKNAVKYVYKAVADPVEGTILTIVRTWSDFIYTNRHGRGDFGQLFLDSKTTLRQALAETTNKLEVLARNNVVDAGANAFVLFIEGVIECIQQKSIRHLVKSAAGEWIPEEIDDAIPVEGHQPQEVKLRYCTEAIIRNCTPSSDRLSAILKDYGDSVVVAGAGSTTRLHVHTNHPDLLFGKLQAYGTIASQKADDMLRQSQTIHQRKWKIALVTDSACDLSTELIDRYQIHMLPLNIYFGDNHYLDKISMRPEQFYRRIDDNGDYPTTAQINEKAFRNLYTHLAAHYDGIIAVHLTSKFSGTYFSSHTAAEAISSTFGKPISVIDSKTLSGAQGLIVLRIARAIEQGVDFEKIVNQATRWISDSEIMVSVKTLKYMVRGGRVAPLKGMLANLLHLNPIVSMDNDGNSILMGKTFSQKTNMKKVMAHIQRQCQNRMIWKYIVLHANNQPAANWYAQQMATLTGQPPVSEVNISPVVGANAGVGAVSVAFMFE
jgi:DegV family protein with EDD domain